ncbi:uncharacterized protein, partial [Clytia hemisphaerica]|uniref:uncharacterized protein n=1 Tax=Clytia hemisphaerica TaxID=252671 RepID=UPI0034D66760
MRRSNRIAGQQPAEDPQMYELNKLVSLRNSRRAQLSSLTRVINQILICLNEGDVQNAFVLQETMLTTYLKFRATNTEYMSMETDPKKIQECEESERRESNRIAEVEREIRGRTRASSVYSSSQGSSENSAQSEYAGSCGSGGSGYHSPSYFNGRSSSPRSENIQNFRFPNPSPPSVSSVTAKSRSSFRRLRQIPSKVAFSDSLSQSSGTYVTQNPTAATKPQKTFLQSIDNFIDDLVEGEETCLAGLSNPVTASAALRYEFESKTLPIIELTKFNGDSAKWPEFIENFSRRVHFKLSFTDNDRIERLLSVLTGEARKGVECIGTSGIFYATALKSLKRDFGNATVVTHAKLKLLLDKPQLVSNDRAALKRFHQQLKSTLTWLKRIGNISAIHSTENLSKAVIRLPDNLRKNFYKKSKDFDDTDLSLFKLETFLDATLKEFYNPIADIIATQENKRRDKKGGNKESQNNYIDSGNDKKLSCWVCQKPHKIWQCDEFQKKKITDRRKLINEKRCCYNCLSPKHSVRECKSKVSCRHCKKRHHSSLHDPNFVDSNDTPEVIESNYGKSNVHTYLQVIPIAVSNGEIKIKVNALLDTGSDTTLIKSSLASKLNLSGKSQTMRISNVLTKKQSFKSKSVNFTISPASQNLNSAIPIQDAWVVDNLNVRMRPYNLPNLKKRCDHLKDISIVQPLKGDVEVLIGADTPEALLHLDFVKGKSKNDPMAVKTIFGWTLFGGRSSEKSVTANFLSFEKLEASVERFWQQESYATTSMLSPALLTKDERRALTLLENGTNFVEGRCEVGMLWRKDKVQLENNRFLAEKRLLSTEKRLEKFPEIKEIYHSKIEEYITLGHVKKLSDTEAKSVSNKINYIPHHFVLEPRKPGKIRIVFDASSNFKGTSLNKSLLPGPNLLNNLVTVLSRFRRGQVAVISDIEKMYHQVLVPEEDQDALRFLWRDKPPDPITEYKMQVHLFGKIDSPCCANWALRSSITRVEGKEVQAFKDLSEENKNRVTEAVTEEFYMDDFLSSFDNTEDAVETCFNVAEVVKGRKFRLTKWLSNEPKLLQAMPTEDVSPKITSRELEHLPHERTLGVWWDPYKDEFFFKIKMKEHQKTKRGLLSFLSSIYDPLGFLAPLLIAPKITLQSMWKEKVGWDDPIPESLLDTYTEWLSTLPEFGNVKVPRWFGFPIERDGVELHVFADASLKAFSSCAYFRAVKDEDVTCSLIVGKSRLSPIKGNTIPRLELQAAVLASRIKHCINNEMRLPIDKSFLWSDSMVVLSYIRNEEKRFSTYVMNRTNEIREKTNVQDWNFVPGKLNPADLGTRPITEKPEDKPIDKWVNGPDFSE